MKLTPPFMVQDRFGKAPDVIRRTSDVDEGLCFEWAPAVMPLPDSPASAGAVAITGPYMPLQGSLLPDADLESFPEQHSLAGMAVLPSSLLSWHHCVRVPLTWWCCQMSACCSWETCCMCAQRCVNWPCLGYQEHCYTSLGLTSACSAQEAQSMEVSQPQATPELKLEEMQPQNPPEAAEVRKEEESANTEDASSAPGPAKGEDEEDEAGASPTSTCSWHGTPTWNDMTTFSQVPPLPSNPPF